MIPSELSFLYSSFPDGTVTIRLRDAWEDAEEDPIHTFRHTIQADGVVSIRLNGTYTELKPSKS